MKSDQYEYKVVLLILGLSLSISAGVIAWTTHRYLVEFPVLLITIYLVVALFRVQTRIHREMVRFVESIRYRDFSHHYNDKAGSPDLRVLFSGFNEINAAFRNMSIEKETQFQFLQNILELVDTGILSFDVENGAVAWMNESLKQLIRLPYLKNMNGLEKRYPELAHCIRNLKPGDRVVAAELVEKNNLKILLSATTFQAAGRKYKLIAFQEAHKVLDETEANAWNKLLRILTHEIMNSVAPISSLAETLKNRLAAAAGNPQDFIQATEDMALSIETIQNRSNGLLKFAETYRRLNKINSLDLKDVYVSDVFEHVFQLMQPSMEANRIEFEIILKDPEIKIAMDQSMIEQSLINLVLNAREAVKETAAPRIILSATVTDNRPVIKVSDNGCGIDKDLVDEIFIPFFSTRKNGSGIGLSLCRQIMLLHKGNIQVQSEKGVGSVFILQF